MQIHIDVNAKTVPTDYSWRFGLGADHAWQFHRRDVLGQLKLAHDELGFERVRFHGIFDDDMFTYQTIRAIAPLPKGAPIREINFRQVADVYDNILSCGMKPFVELSFMPEELAKKHKQGLKYKNNICPPKDHGAWADYIERFIRFLLDRYGRQEVESWYFEVWNEPDLGIFFGGTQKDYFRLYETTACAIKRVDNALRVGGPSTSACRWVPEFLDFCKQNDVPVDFVSTHHYPGDGFGNSINASNYLGIGKTILRDWKAQKPLGETLTDMFFRPEAAASVPKDALVNLDEKLLAQAQDLPTIISEWNSMAIFSVPLHDEKYSAAFVLKSVLDLNNSFKGYMFWCLSDIFEEQLQLNRPFIGGFGILTVDGIPKPNFWAFKMLSQFYPQRLDLGFRQYGDVVYAAFRNDDSLQILVCAQSNDPRENRGFDVELVLNCETEQATVQIIDDAHCNPKEEWEKLGSPDYLKLTEVEEIKEKTRLREESASFTCIGGGTTIRCSLSTNDAKLYTIKMRGGK